MKPNTHTLTSVCIIPLDWGMTTRRSALRLAGTRLFPGCERGGDLGGKIFPKLLPPGEPTKPFTTHRNREDGKRKSTMNQAQV